MPSEEAEQQIRDLNQQVSQLYEQEKYAEALELARQTCERARRVLGEEHSDTVTSLNYLGDVLQAIGDLAGARLCFEQALEIRRRILGEDHRRTASSFKNLGEVLRDMGELVAARPCYEKALDICRRVLGNDHPNTAACFNHLGLLLYKMGDLAGARPYYEDALEISRRVQSDDRLTTATYLENLSLLLRKMGDLTGARRYCEEAVEINRRVLGDDHLETVGCLNNMGVILSDMGDVAAARACHDHALEIRRRVLGEDDPSTATSMNNLGLLLREIGDLAGGRVYLEQALGIFRRVRGDDHPDTVTSLNNLGLVLKDMGDLAGALPYFEQALAIRRRVLGENHPDTATGFNNLGMLLQDMGDMAGAHPYLELALAIRRRVLGDDHPDTASSLHNLGLQLKNMGNLIAARPYLEQSLEINRRVLGDDHYDTAISLDSLGVLLQEMGDFAAARPCLEQALEITRRVQGDDHLATATSLHNLGVLLRDMGDLTAAWSYLEQSLHTFRRVLGDDHPSIATSLNILGLLFSDLGDRTAARACLEEALRIDRRVLGENHPSTANSLNNLGCLFQDMGDLAAARPYYEQALEIHRVTLGENHPDTATNLNNLGNLLNALRDPAAGRLYLEQALEISRRALGDNHPETAGSLSNLGMLLLDLGYLTEARSYLVQTLTIFRHTLGDDHPKTARSLSNLATLEVASGRIEEALALEYQAIDIDDRTIGRIFSIGSDRQRLLFLETLQGDQDSFLSLVYRHLSHSSQAVRIAFDLVLRRKALATEALAAQRDAVLGGHYPHLRDTFVQLTQLRRRIAQKTLAGSAAGETLAAHEQTLHQWRQEQQQRETELARQIPEVSLEQRLRQADRRAVALGLDEGVALVEFIRFDVFDFHAVPARGERRWQPARYLAFVLPGGHPDEVRMIDLGEARPIDLMIADFRASVAVDPHDRPDRDIRRQPPESPGAVQAQVGPALHATVFDKLVPALGGCKRLLLAPDGDLTRLPFEVLPDVDGRLLLEQYAISYLSCGRDVLRFKAAPSGQAAEPLVVADPLFDFAADADPSAPAASTRSRCSRDFKRSDYHFPRLPATRQEGERVAELLGVRPWLDSTALEARLKERRSPRVLHLATHGFFLTDQERDPNKESRALEMIGAEGDIIGRLSGPLPENPLLRSGLALAGAQTWIDGKALPPEAEDGLLTAEDVTGLDLLNTELVVLSACDTGLGEVHTGEGVFGLRRAFTVAGARTLVMSLWKVPDEQTRELMIDFYRRVLSGQGVADALRQAQLAMKEKHPDPYFWGAFICQGDPGPLSLSCRKRLSISSPAIPSIEAE
jgi:tetratricopeptide (TPR) repeat protein/CHAT domain-containing protein